jgi:hypothetical protein
MVFGVPSAKPARGLGRVFQELMPEGSPKSCFFGLHETTVKNPPQHGNEN